MPRITLVVCVCNERELLQRLLRKATGCYDDLVVVHDGPDSAGLNTVVKEFGGRFFERPRANQQEPNWPFAWGQAANDWILRLDVDEFPGEELRRWLEEFRRGPEPKNAIAGFTCIWPLWNGRRSVTSRWPTGRNFLFHKQRVRFFGMAETVPIPDTGYEALQLVLHHEPKRKSYGIRNVLLRKQAYRWRTVIARSLMGSPTELPCWRWYSGDWPPVWEVMRRKPLRTGFKRLLLGPVWQAREMWQVEHKIVPTALLGTGLHQFLMAITFFFFRLRRFRRINLQ